MTYIPDIYEMQAINLNSTHHCVQYILVMSPLFYLAGCIYQFNCVKEFYQLMTATVMSSLGFCFFSKNIRQMKDDSQGQFWLIFLR